MNRNYALAASIIASGMAWGCTNNGQNHTAANSPAPGAQTQSPNYAAVAAAEAAKEAVAQIHGAGDTHDKIHGTATFTAVDKGLKVVVDVDGLTPGKHGIHIHEKADLSDPKLMSVGGHFNPEGAEHHHAGLDDTKRHAGDLGNITVDSNGHGHLDAMTDALSIEGKNGVVGHSIIIHEKEDDLKTQQPPGNAGGRVAGGAVMLATGSQRSGA
jgi:Cu-Zn family superoxide dismutase